MHPASSTSNSGYNECQETADRRPRATGGPGGVPLLHAVPPDRSAAGWRDAPATSASPATLPGSGAALGIGDEGKVALLEAARRGALLEVKLLVDSIGLAVTGSARKLLPECDRVLAEAAAHGHLDVVRYLLTAAELLDSTALRYPAFRKAAAAGQAGVAAFLMARESVESVRLQAVFEAVNFGHEGVLQALIEAGCPVDTKVQGGRSPLEAAFSKGNLAMTRRLLDAGAVISDKLLRRAQRILQETDANPSAAAADAVVTAWRSRAAHDAGHH